jgi:hypothetical protein
VNGRCAFAPLALLILLNTSLRAEPLAQPEKAYVALMTLSVGVTNMCDGYDVDDTNVLKFANARAVDIKRFGPATLNALEAIVGTDHDRSALIPEVTGAVQSVTDKMTHDVSRLGRTVVCDQYGKQLISVGFLRQVNEPALGRRHRDRVP